MVKRFSWKQYVYTGFALLMLLVCWESGRTNAMLFTAKASAAEADNNGSGIIPAEAIRLRILANSDAPSDQWIKREIRDAILEQMSTWMTAPEKIGDAREVIKRNLPALEALVGETLQKNGYDYAFKVELGMVPFPAKVYDNKVYPAGDYEALRVSIGASAGQNWWCVLFPPLCFVESGLVVNKGNTAHAAEAEDEADAAGDNKEAAAGKKPEAKKESSAASGDKSGKTAKSDKGTEVSNNEKKVEAKAQTGKTETAGPEVRFFLWDLLKQVTAWFA